MKKNVFFIILIISTIQGCGPKAKEARETFFTLFKSEFYYRQFGIDSIKQKYSAEAINYFYETAFGSDYGNKKKRLRKWSKDISIYMDGEFNQWDVSYLKNAIAKLDSLQLPIKLNITPDSSAANLLVYYGDYPYLREMGIQKDSAYWESSFIHGNNIIKSAIIGIANNANLYKTISKTDSILVRQSIILRGLTQCLGILGDSWLYPNSLFFRGVNRPNFSEIDKDVIKLMYEPNISLIYSREQFETDFGDMLYHVNAPQKIADYIEAYNIPLRHIDYIHEKCFDLTDSIFLKWSSEVNVLIKGDFLYEDSVFCEKAVNFFNTMSSLIKLKLTDNHNYNLTHPLIEVLYTHNDTLKDDITLKLNREYKKMISPIRYKCKINIIGDIKEINQEKRNNALFSAIYESITSNYKDVSFDIMAIDSLGNISVKPDYKEVFELVNETVLYSGMHINELDQAIEILKAKGYEN